MIDEEMLIDELYNSREAKCCSCLECLVAGNIDKDRCLNKTVNIAGLVSVIERMLNPIDA